MKDEESEEIKCSLFATLNLSKLTAEHCLRFAKYYFKEHE